MFEHLRLPPLPRLHFLWRLGLYFLMATGLMVASLFLGMAGYMYFEGLDGYDAFLDAAMLLGGMGPVHPPVTTKGKLFAGFYALYAGLVFLVAAGVLMAPVVHRLLHKLHWDDDERA